MGPEVGFLFCLLLVLTFALGHRYGRIKQQKIINEKLDTILHIRNEFEKEQHEQQKNKKQDD